MYLRHLLSLLAGLLLPFLLPVESAPDIWLGGLGIGAGLWCAGVLWKARRVRLLFAALSLLHLGGWLSAGALADVLQQVQRCAAIDSAQQLSARFLEVRRRPSGQWQALIRTDKGDMAVDGSAGVLPWPGQTYRIRLRMRPASTMPAAYLLRSGICARARVLGFRPVTGADLAENRAGWQTRLRIKLGAVRGLLRDRLQTAIGSEPAAAAVGAVTLGDTANVPPELWTQLRNTGTVHLLVISGLHLGLVALFSGLLLGWTVRLMPRALLWWPMAYWRWIGALTGAAVYATLAGYGISARRAMTMLVIAAVILVLRRRLPAGFKVLALALVCLLLLDPLSALSPGLWLSLSGVAVLWSYGRLHRPFYAPNQLWRKWWTFVPAQMAIMCGLSAPLLLAGGFPAPLGLPANLLAVPLIAFLVVPTALAGIVLLMAAPLQPLALPVLTVARELMGLALRWLEILSDITGDYAIGATGAAGAAGTVGWGLLLGAVALWIFILPPGFPGRLLWPLFLATVLAGAPKTESVLEIRSGGHYLTGRIQLRGYSVVFQSGRQGLRFAASPGSSEDYGCPALFVTAGELHLRSLAAGTAGCALQLRRQGHSRLITGQAGAAGEQHLVRQVARMAAAGGSLSGYSLFSPVSSGRFDSGSAHSYPLLALLRPEEVYLGLLPAPDVRALSWRRYRWFGVKIRGISADGIRCTGGEQGSCRHSADLWWHRRMRQ